jgi:uncharacterized protein (DUF433 family)
MPYVRTDEHGVMRVGRTRVSLDSVVIAFQEGLLPESIRREYPALTLKEVRGAIAYYLANRESVEDYLRQQDDKWEQARREAQAHPSPVVERLRSVLRQQTAIVP